MAKKVQSRVIRKIALMREAGIKRRHKISDTRADAFRRFGWAADWQMGV